jgi:hydroxyquinol 1,2-dioxygenase
MLARQKQRADTEGQNVRDINEYSITEAVVSSMTRCADARLQTILTSLVQHLHAFARDVRLTEDEWSKAIAFLTQVGDITDERRQEFILLSDTLGLSTLVMSQSTGKPASCTESTVFGPFFVYGAPIYHNGDDISNGARGAPCYVKGQVRGADGEAVGNAWIDVWQSDEDGFYDVQRLDDSHASSHRARGRLRTDAEGFFNFRTILAEAYPIPHDGPVGRMLAATGRHPWRPAHLHFRIEAPGFETLITQVFREGDRYLDSDVVFGVRSTLVADWIRHDPGIAPDGRRIEVPWYTLDYDFILNRAQILA